MLTLAKSAFARLERLIQSRQAYKFIIKDWVALTDLNLCAQVVSTMRFSRNLIPLQMLGPKGNRLIVIAPHPDDEMLGPGGTLISAILSGKYVKVIYLTNGKDGDAAAQEASAVANRIGYDTEFLDYSLEDIPVHEEALVRLSESITASKGDTLFLPFMFDDHDDHRRASEVVYRAFEAGLLAPSMEIWGYQVYTALLPNVVVDVTEVMPKKLNAVRMWKSQFVRRDWAHYISGLNAFNSRFLATAGKPSFVEAFFVLPLKDYADLCSVYFKNRTSAYYTSQYTQIDATDIAERT
jgi:LmbE family N-acetylglucosaminyl deacetylase